MHVIFVTYSESDNCELNCEKFCHESLSSTEESAKRWLFDSMSHHLFNNITENKSKSEIENMFIERSMDDLIRFIHDSSYVHVQTIYYSHE